MSPGAPARVDTHAVPDQPVMRMNRNDLIALGRSGKPREFLPVIAQVLPIAPRDAGLRFLTALNFASLGLRTLAGEHLAMLPDVAGGDPDVRALAGAIGALPDDRVAADVRARTALGNLRVLRSRGIDLSDAFGRWSGTLDRSECFLDREGNIVRRLGRPGAPGVEHFLSDQRAVASRFVRAHLGELPLFPRPLAIEGIDPPWVFLECVERLGANALGYAPTITLLQTDELEFIDGLSVRDMRTELASPRVRVFVGSDASARFEHDALERMDEVVIGGIVPLGCVRARLTPGVPEVQSRVARAQQSETDRLESLVRARYAGRDRAWWAERFARAGEPLRVLVPTSRYSTFIRHAAADLARAFERAGWRAEVVMEAANDRRLSRAAYLRVIERLAPDLVVMINYARGQADLPIPDELPWVTWFQDSLPHQFRGGAAPGPLDFAIGHVHREIPGRDAARTRSFPVVASTEKFHPRPSPDAASLACELALVSHHSETPEELHDRCVREDGDDRTREILDALRPEVHRLAADPMAGSLQGALERATREVIRGVAGEGATPALETYIYRHYALRLADRALRHRTLGWAADLCERRGWRLAIFGRGWERHERFARFARGGLAHGEPLRACYQGARAHLHVSAMTLVHQRVMECALSGGLPICRLTFDALSEGGGFAKRAALLSDARPRTDENGRTGYRLGECAELLAEASQRRALGLDWPDVVWITPEQRASLLRSDHPAATGMHARWLLGDLSRVCFRTPEELESVLERAVRDDVWRRETSASIAGRVRDRASHDALVKQIVGLVRTGLAAGRSHADEAAPAQGRSRDALRAA